MWPCQVWVRPGEVITWLLCGSCSTCPALLKHAGCSGMTNMLYPATPALYNACGMNGSDISDVIVHDSAVIGLLT